MTKKDELLKDRRVSVRVAGTKILARVVSWVKPRPRVYKERGMRKTKPHNWHRKLRAKNKAAKLARRQQR